MKNFIQELRENRPTVFWLNILSLLFAVIPPLYCMIFFFLPNKFFGTWIFLIPFLFIFLVTFLSHFIYKKFPLITNIIVVVINLYIIFILQLFAGLILFAVLFEVNEEYKFNKPECYEEIIGNYEQEKVAHFPKTIPKGAKNVKMGGYFVSFFGSEEVFIKFDIDKSYIDKELLKYKFIKKVKADALSSFNYVANHCDININDYDIYIINGKLIPRGDCYGIGVNKNKTQIVYFYLDPD